MRASCFLTGPHGVKGARLTYAEEFVRSAEAWRSEVKDKSLVSQLQHQVRRTWLCVDEAVLDYREAWRLQVELVAARHAAVPRIITSPSNRRIRFLLRQGLLQLARRPTKAVMV